MQQYIKIYYSMFI